jgi:hypothetical protein
VIVAGQSDRLLLGGNRVGRDADEAKDPAPLPPEAQPLQRYGDPLDVGFVRSHDENNGDRCGARSGPCLRKGRGSKACHALGGTEPGRQTRGKRRETVTLRVGAR